MKEIGRKIRSVSEYCEIRIDFHKAQMCESSHCSGLTRRRWQDNRGGVWREGMRAALIYRPED